jgi:single-strand DNA-binding protein
MAGVNKVILIGNLGADPEMKYLEGGAVIARFNMATSETYTKNGERITQTEWHRIELWDNLAKIAEQYLKKGDTAYIEGKIRTEEWQDKDGNNRTTLRIRGSNLTLLGGRRNEASGETTSQQTPTAMEKPAPVANSIIKEEVPKEALPPVMANSTEEDDLPF